MSRLPSFFIVGAAKCGTSSLASYLGQHPQIGIAASKEPNYFCFKDRDLRTFKGPVDGETLYWSLYRWSTTDEQSYLKLFQHVYDRPMLGEASVRYLYYPPVAARISQCVPDAKIVIMLRDPVQRLWSHYAMMRAVYQLEPAPLMDALQQEDRRIADGWDFDWHYIKVGRYAAQVRRYLDCFGADRVRVYFFEDFARQPGPVVRDIFGFLGVNQNFVPDMTYREKPGYWLRSFWLDKLLSCRDAKTGRAARLLKKHRFRRFLAKILHLNRTKIPTLNEDSSRALKVHFADEAGKLESCLGRPVPWPAEARS
jgi:sulfotransferase family protein